MENCINRNSHREIGELDQTNLQPSVCWGHSGFDHGHPCSSLFHRANYAWSLQGLLLSPSHGHLRATSNDTDNDRATSTQESMTDTKSAAKQAWQENKFVNQGTATRFGVFLLHTPCYYKNLNIIWQQATDIWQLSITIISNIYHRAMCPCTTTAMPAWLGSHRRCWASRKIKFHSSPRCNNTMNKVLQVTMNRLSETISESRNPASPSNVVEINIIKTSCYTSWDWLQNFGYKASTATTA